jgi:fission process protein 1
MAKKDSLDDIPHERKEPRPDSLSKPIPGKPLPKKIESLLSNEEKLWEVIDDDK